jgi:hypothetical protein
MKTGFILRHQFVEFIPEPLDPGTIYISIRFATASHLCCCGCGQKVVTPITPTDWRLIFDGKTVSLDPSVGNWGFACRSHYWIRNNRVLWAEQWTDSEIKRGRSEDRNHKTDFFKGANTTVNRGQPPPSASETPWAFVKRWWYGLK